MPSPTIKKLQARVEELKALNKQLKNTIKKLNANIKSLSDAQRRTELQSQASLARAAAGARNLRKPLHAIALVQGELEVPARDKSCRKAASRIKRALATAGRGLDKLERLGAHAQDDQTALPGAASPSRPAASRPRRRRQPDVPAPHAAVRMIYILDNDSASLDAIVPALQEAGYAVRTFASAARFADSYRPGGEICIVVNAWTADMGGVELIERLQGTHLDLPPIILTGDGDTQTVRAATRAGAAAFIEKPLNAPELLLTVSSVVERFPDPVKIAEKIGGKRQKIADGLEKMEPGGEKIAARGESAAARLATLSKRERQVLALVIEGHPSKNIAADLGVSQRTIENHRASIMRKMGAKSLAQLVRLVLAKK